MNVRALAIAFVLSSAALAGCGGSGTTIVSATPGPTCAPGGTVQMVYPIPGATSVPDNPQQLVFAVSTALPNTWDAAIGTSASLSSAFYTVAGVETISASQVPTPAATPSFASPTYQSVTLAGGLAAATTYYVWLNNLTAANNCTPLGPLGSFTTQ